MRLTPRVWCVAIEQIMMDESKAGLDAEQWLKMWESELGPEYQHCADEADSHSTDALAEGCGDFVIDQDQHGNKLKVDAILFRNILNLTGGKTGETVFVSLCGSSPDLEWLCNKGYSVVGVEVSETAVKTLFGKACAGPIPYTVSVEDEVTIYSATDGKSLKVYIGNFFSDGVSHDRLGTFDFIWDAHGMVSIPVSQQECYAKKLFNFLKPGGRILFSTVSYDIAKLVTGPAPAPIPASKLQNFFPGCNVKQLEEKALPGWELDGVESWTNPVVLVSAP